MKRPAQMKRGPQPCCRPRSNESLPDEAAAFPALGGHLQHVGSLWPLRSLDDIEFNVFAFFQGLEPFSLERGIMDKHIFSIFKTDEPEPLPVIEPLDGTFASHALLLSSTLSMGHSPANLSETGKKMPQKGTSSCGRCNTSTYPHVYPETQKISGKHLT